MSNSIDKFKAFNDKTLIKFHESATNAYESDRGLTSTEKEAAQQFGNRHAYYGTDYFSDWPVYVDELEAELGRRKINFTPITK